MSHISSRLRIGSSAAPGLSARAARLLSAAVALALFSALGAESAEAQARVPVTSAPEPVAEATFPDGSTGIFWPILPLGINGQILHAIVDVGTTANFLAFDALRQLKVPLPLDSVVIGTRVHRHEPFQDGQFDPGIVGMVGTPLLSQYDLVFDGANGVVRFYAQPAHATTGAPSWFPTGVTPRDCMPMSADPQGANRIFFPLEANGHAIHSMFDSGSETTNLNVAAARVLGLHSTDSSVHLLPRGVGGQFSRFNGQRIWRATGVTLAIGDQRITRPINIYEDLPRESSPNDPELSLGLNAVRDRVLYVSYSTKTVCIGGPDARAAMATQQMNSTANVPPQPVLSAEQVEHYIALKQALVPYWQVPSRAVFFQMAGATSHSHTMMLDEDRPTTRAFDYPALVAQDRSLAVLFAQHHLAPAEFESTQVAVTYAMIVLTYNEAMGRPLPDASTTLGKNVAVVRPQREALAALGLGLPPEQGPSPIW